MKTFKKILVQPKSLVMIFIVTAAIIITSVVIELDQSKKEMTELMERQGHTLLESILKSSENALFSYEQIENEVKKRLLSNAFLIRELYSNGMVSNGFLQKIAEQNDIYRINIFDKNGNKKFTNIEDAHEGIPERVNPVEYLQPIFNGEKDTLIIGIKPARYFDGQRFTVAVACKNRSAIVLNVDAEELLSFRRQVGFGVLLKKVTENPQIKYAALQNEYGIIAASGEVTALEPIDSLEIVWESIEENTDKWRIADFDSLQVFEIFHPFIYRDQIVGIFRLGLSLDPLNHIKERITRRVIFLGIVLFIFGFVTITLIFARQNFAVLSNKFKAIESYSTSILKHVSDSIIVLNNESKIVSVNSAAEKLLGNPEEQLKGKELNDFLGTAKCEELFNSTKIFEEIECTMNGSNRVFLISKSMFVDEDGNTNTILVLKDRTEQKTLEKQIERSERLAAMGELASSVAHEIRNPLNSIGTITQQLNKDFIPQENDEEYKALTKIVYKEVRRINDIIESFLKFARPQPIKPEDFALNELLEQIEKQYGIVVEKKKGKLQIENHYTGNVIWDRKQITQVLVNLIENAVDAIDNNGEIKIAVDDNSSGNIEMKISDNGNGISQDNMNKIFNLYFTTKTKGNGIGLSVVQKIISDHGGVISLNSELGKGTTFTIVIPKEYS